MSATRVRFALLAALPVLLAASGVHSSADAGPDGDASARLATSPTSRGVEAAFAARSYSPGADAVLNLRGGAPLLRIGLYRAAAGHEGRLQGLSVGPTLSIPHPPARVRLTVGSWPSGLYYAKVTTPGIGSWYAPFVVRPHRLGVHRVLVVLPTNTWQAYNFEDGDSWYADSTVNTVLLTRPFVDGGVPPHYRGYDRGFLRWLVLHHLQPDFMSDDDLDAVSSGDVLARAYTLIVFPGHEEYVTAHAYDLITRYRNLGGNLAFLSANDFFYKVVKHGDRMDGRWRWRDVGRPEASLVGAQYVDWNHGRYRNRPFTVTGVERARWLFRGTSLHDGDTFGVYGIEVDARAPNSPPGTRVLANIPGIFGPGVNAEMTYYATATGAKVFSAGVMNFGGSALWPVVSTMLSNLWTEMTRS